MSGPSETKSKLGTLTLKLSARAQYLLISIILLSLIGGLVFTMMEMSDIRRDLYAVRDDYYGGNSEDDTQKIDYQLISQEVRQLRVPDYGEGKSYEEIEYKKENVRVLEVKITNNRDYLFMYYESLAAVGENGVLERSISVHPDDNQNDWYENYGSLELVPGGESTIFVYLLDSGNEITKIYDTESSTAIDLY